jgi:hypothetical protein
MWAIYPDSSWANDEKWWIHESQQLLCIWLMTTSAETKEEDLNADQNEYWFLLLADFMGTATAFQRVSMLRLKRTSYQVNVRFRLSHHELDEITIY